MSREPELSVDETLAPEPLTEEPDGGQVEEAEDRDEPQQPITPSPAQLRRRRRRRSLGLVVVLGAVFVGTVLWSRGVLRHDRDKRVLAIAPSVLFEEMCETAKKNRAKKLHVSEFEVEDGMMEHVAALDSIETLILDQGRVTDQAIISIAKLPQLKHLRLRLSPIGDQGLALLSQVDSLWYLNLPHAVCTAEGISHLADLPRLRQLRIGSPTLGNEVAREIASIRSLRGIHLIGVPVTDEGLKKLAAMPYLESLYLDDCAVTEAGWDWLFREHPHLHVHIDQAHHDRDPKTHRHH